LKEKIYVGRAEKKKTERIQKLKDDYRKKMEEYQKFQGLNLYFKNIDESAYSEEMLKKAFLDFGEITSFVLMRNDDEKKNYKRIWFRII